MKHLKKFKLNESVFKDEIISNCKDILQSLMDDDIKSNIKQNYVLNNLVIQLYKNSRNLERLIEYLKKENIIVNIIRSHYLLSKDKGGTSIYNHKYLSDEYRDKSFFFVEFTFDNIN